MSPEQARLLRIAMKKPAEWHFVSRAKPIVRAMKYLEAQGLIEVQRWGFGMASEMRLALTRENRELLSRPISDHHFE